MAGTLPLRLILARSLLQYVQALMHVHLCDSAGFAPLSFAHMVSGCFLPIC